MEAIREIGILLVESPDVRCWHQADMLVALVDVRLWG
jgi:hypothetical protein